MIKFIEGMGRFLSYKKGFWISSDRKVMPYFFFEKIGYKRSAISVLDEINLITESLGASRDLDRSIEFVLSGEWSEFEISTNMTSFEIGTEYTFLKNYLFKEPDVQIATDQLLKIVKDKITFVESMQEEFVLAVVKKGMETVKLSPVRDSENFYSVNSDEGLYLRFALHEAIADLDTEEFIKSLSVNM